MLLVQHVGRKYPYMVGSSSSFNQIQFHFIEQVQKYPYMVGISLSFSLNEVQFIKFNLTKAKVRILSWLGPHPQPSHRKGKRISSSSTETHRPHSHLYPSNPLHVTILILIFTFPIHRVTITIHLRFALASLEQCSSSLSALKGTSTLATGPLWWVHFTMTHNIVL